MTSLSFNKCFSSPLSRTFSLLSTFISCAPTCALEGRRVAAIACPVLLPHRGIASLLSPPPRPKLWALIFEMAGYMSRGPPNGSIYVCNLPPGTDETMLAEYFGTIGLLKKDKRTGQPKIWIYRDKLTNEPKGDATVTYEDPHAASAAVEWFDNKDFHGSIIQVHIAESKSKDAFDNSTNLSVTADLGGQEELDNGSGRGRGRGDGPGKAWQQDGDWQCPNTSCGNVNFAFRGVCNRCGASRPAGVSGTGAGGGRGRGRGSDDAKGGSRATVGGPPGLFGPNDWPCTMCGNVNWAKRTKCNVCNTTKPGHNEGGVRGGRGGGYKELDEEELEEVRRRRKEAEEDDGEIYDEFGNLKKKFRVKSQHTESAPPIPGSGRAGWEAEKRGSTEREGRERSRDRGRDEYNERGSRDRDRDRGSHGRDRRRSRSRSRDRERERGRDRGRDHGNVRSWERGTERDRDRYR